MSRGWARCRCCSRRARSRVRSWKCTCCWAGSPKSHQALRGVAKPTTRFSQIRREMVDGPVILRLATATTTVRGEHTTFLWGERERAHGRDHHSAGAHHVPVGERDRARPKTCSCMVGDTALGRFFIFVVVETYREARNAAEREGWRRRRHRIVQKGGLSRGWTRRGRSTPSRLPPSRTAPWRSGTPSAWAKDGVGFHVLRPCERERGGGGGASCERMLGSSVCRLMLGSSVCRLWVSRQHGLLASSPPHLPSA